MTNSDNYSVMNTPLLAFSDSDTFTVRHACEGVAVFGATGSGKTSGSGKALAMSFLQSGFGGLVLTVKPDDRQTFTEYAREAGREESVLVFSPDDKYRFNFLDYELHRAGRGGGNTENIVNLFLTVLEAGEQGKSGGDDY